MKRFFQKIPPWVCYLALVFVFLLLVFSSFRHALYYLSAGNEGFSGLRNSAFLLGISYDVMVSSYLLILPVVCFFIVSFWGQNSRWFRRIITCYFVFVFFLVLLSCSADIPYYKFSGSRLNTAIIMWADTPGTMLNYVFDTSEYYPHLAVFLFSLIASVIFLLFLQKKFLARALNERPSLSKGVVAVAIVSFLLLIGIRGGFRLRPIGIKDAFTTNFPLINLLPLNPVYTFFDSMSDVRMDYLPEEEAIKNAKRFLFSENTFSSPIARNASFSDSAVKPNIVLVLMESMSADMTGFLGKKGFATPFLDSISAQSLSFTNFYTSGTHTCNGIYGTLYSVPTIPGQHPLSNVRATNQKFYGMANTLLDNGYQTSFFCTHYEEFDNMGYFLPNNGFEKIFSAKDFSPDKMEGTFGVSDETLFDFIFEKISSFSKSEKPFFTSLLTISAHEPPTLPKKTSFVPKSEDRRDKVYEYADWALRNFVQRCSKEKWFNNTVFVFIADHGCNLHSAYEMSLSYHHSPFIIYSPSLIKEPKKIDALALQLDVFPTLMGLFKIPHINNSFGMDLFRQERPFAFFCKDDMIGCLDKSHFLVIRKFGGESLHEYKSGKSENVIEKRTALADSMKTYTYSMLQTTNWLLENKKLGKQ